MRWFVVDQQIDFLISAMGHIVGILHPHPMTNEKIRFSYSFLCFSYLMSVFTFICLLLFGILVCVDFLLHSVLSYKCFVGMVIGPNSIRVLGTTKSRTCYFR